MDEVRFARKIRTSRAGQPTFPVFIHTVEEAIDHVQELPPEGLALPHWSAAKTALWASLDNPKDQERLAAAEAALKTALVKEGWLNDIKAL